MKRYPDKKFYALLICACLLASTPAPAAAREKLTYILTHKEPVKVFLKDFVNESGQGKVSANILRNDVKNALVNRRSVRFAAVAKEEESDITVEAAVKAFRYMERGPVKITPGLGTTMLDLAASATMNYADIQGSFVIREAGTGRVLHVEDVYIHLKRKMTEDESVPLVLNKFARQFVVEAFGRPRGRRTAISFNR